MEQKTIARDVFMYLLVVIVLAMSAVSLGALVFDFVNVYLPDPVRASSCAYDGCAGAVNGEVAVLLVAFPVFLWAWRFISRDAAAHPEKKDIWVRRWLLYLALFVSGIAAIIDTITLVVAWLNGDLTLQFALKVVTVLLIAGTIFFVFLRELHPKKSSAKRIVGWAAVVAVVAALIAGVWTSAPWNARERGFDSDRVAHLQDIQWRVVNYWQNNQRLPDSLASLNDPVGAPLPNDPEAALGHPGYEYSRTGNLSFTLCATFALESLGNTAPSVARPVAVGGVDERWTHAAGHVCFERSIDPSLYPPTKVPVR